MKVAVLNNWVPFVRGGAEHLADALTLKLNEYGHQAVLVKLPFAWNPPAKIPEHILACRLMRLPNVDRAIGLKFPACHVPHPNKVLWLLHQFRQAYDLWNTPYQDLPDTAEGRRIRDMIHCADDQYLAEAKKVYVISPVIGERLLKFNRIDSEVLFHPLLDTEHLHGGDFGDYVFLPGRITQTKRQLLAVEAMHHVRSDVRLVLAGAAESPEHAADLRRRIRAAGLEKRVSLMAHFIPEAEKVELLAGSLACLYLPYDEDSYGYVPLEAYYCRKPVVTCSDSGGALILVKDQLTGMVVPPDPVCIAEAIDRLAADRALARRMGEAGFEFVQELKINWDRVIACLTA